jgi:cytochrome b subunit of formate dehydrogenase
LANTVVPTKTGPHGTVATTKEKSRVWMQIVVSLILLITGILILTSPNFILTHQYDEGIKKSAAGWVGAVIGYWLS